MKRIHKMPERNVLLSWYLFYELDGQPNPEPEQLQSILRSFDRQTPDIICMLIASDYKEFKEKYLDAPCGVVINSQEQANLLDVDLELPFLVTLSESGSLSCWDIASDNPLIAEFAYNLEQSGDAFLTGPERAWLEKRRAIKRQ